MRPMTLLVNSDTSEPVAPTAASVSVSIIRPTITVSTMLYKF